MGRKVGRVGGSLKTVKGFSLAPILVVSKPDYSPNEEGELLENSLYTQLPTKTSGRYYLGRKLWLFPKVKTSNE